MKVRLFFYFGLTVRLFFYFGLTEQKEMKQAFAGMLQEQKEMKRVQQEMQNKIEEIETKAEERHKEILDQLTALKHDQDFIWEKTVRHEREIHAIKMKLS
ncbi:hypothetical protein [Caldibacillus thermoamylovorans]|uniref:hypothetical protein n=1 Tax=Caldibacillus thermoamylovorans TaxID=35841 RepID=UPI00203CD1EC|nr:hypothetical protein [Caldibacillus thermoamylovorans]MCM3479176.1 hypothetical protein [Caldibacillus thermoamylovorans]